MQIRNYPVFGGAGVNERLAGPIYETDVWPRGMRVEHLLRALCGSPDEEGWFPYNELDCRWICFCLQQGSQLSGHCVGALAMLDHVNLRATPEQLSIMAFEKSEPTISQIAAASFATVLIARAFEATHFEAAEIVRLNLFTERVPA